MKKLFILLPSFILLLIIIVIIGWFNIPNILAYILSNKFNVTVTIGNVNISKNNLLIKELSIKNPKGSKTNTAFYSKEIDIRTTLKNLKSEELTIKSLNFNNNIIGIEFYNKTGKDNNWNRILKSKNSKNKIKRKYLIKKLILNNLTVILTKENSQKQTFPTIEKLEFYNISDETGFPIEEIEKAIAQTIIKSIFEKYNLLNLLKELSPTNLIKKITPII